MTGLDVYRIGIPMTHATIAHPYFLVSRDLFSLWMLSDMCFNAVESTG